MVSLLELWLPILLSALFVFIVSSIIHTVLPIHKSDYKKLPTEETVVEVLRAQDLRPGAYMFPFAESIKDAGAPEMLEKYKKGPVGILTVLPNTPVVIGKHLVQWFLYTILFGFFVAYVATLGLARGSDYTAVFRLTGTVAILGYALSYIPDSIWKGQTWGTTIKYVLDGVAYALVTAGTFGWLWPAAA